MYELCTAFLGRRVDDGTEPFRKKTPTISAFAGSTAMKYIDPSGSFGQHNEEDESGEQRADRGRWGVRSLRDYYALCGNSAIMKKTCAAHAKLADKVLRDFEGGSDTTSLVGKEQYYVPRRSIVSRPYIL